MAAPTPMLLSKNSQAGLLELHNQCYNMFNQQWDIRAQMLDVDLQYARENDWTKENKRAQLANRYGDKNRFQNVTIPVVMPQVEAAVTYQSSVFLTGIPIFGVVADPQFEDEALALETAIDNQATYGGWTRELTLFFRDGFKYNLSAIEVNWCRDVTVALETDIGFSAKQAKPKQVIWEGNRLKRWDPYNTVFDTRVTPAEMHRKGEFIGNTELMSRIQLKKYINELPDVRLENVIAAFNSGMGAISFNGAVGGVSAFYIPQVNPRSILNANIQLGTNWEAWAGLSKAHTEIAYKNMYEVTTLYARILPSDFNIKVPESNTPQVWKFVWVNHQVLLYAERQTNAHGYLPVLMGQPLEDGLAYQTKSLAQNVSPIQDITSALSNSNIAARRRAISDRTLYDPSRVTEAHINNENPSAKIPVRPAAYGKPVGDSVYPFPFRDDQAQFVSQQIQQYGAMANMISGQNPVRQGQFVKGNKTQHEFADVMSHANGRDQLIAIAYEAQVFAPMKEILKINILQYQGGISLFNRETQKNVQLDPVTLRKAVLNFKVSDGLTPIDKLINADTMQVALQVFGSSPEISSAYNIAPFFSYMMKTQGAHISAFEKSPQQQAYEQAMQQYQQMVMQLFKQNPDIKQEQLPKQPMPQDYGYDPAQKAGSDASNPPSNVPASQSQQPAGQPVAQQQ